VDFNRDWHEYKAGFGDLETEFWAGNDFLHVLTNQKTYELHVDMVDFEKGPYWASYKRSWTRSPPNRASKFFTYSCSYGGKPVHKAEVCRTRLQLNTGKPAMIVTEETNTSPVGVMADLSKADSMPIGLVFTKGEVWRVQFRYSPHETLILSRRVLRRTQTLVPFVPFCHKARVVAARKTDKYVVLGSLWGQGVAPLVLVHVKSSCFSGIANVTCVHELPVAGVDLIL
ncbi:Techylectin-5B-like 5, partial [Homarus americanus]